MTLLEEPRSVHTPAAKPQAEVSRRIVEPLQMVAGRARVLRLLQALFQWMVLVLAVWLPVVLLLGGMREPAMIVAFALAAAAWATLLFGGFLLLRPAFRRTDLTAAARLVDSAVPDTDERISSALELSQEEDKRFQGSPELIAALVRQAEHAAERVDPSSVISGRHVFKWFLGTVPLLLLWFVLFVVLTPALVLGVERLFQPWRAAAPVVRAILEVDPRDVTVAQGDSLTIHVTVTPLNAVGNDTSKKVPGATIAKRFTAGQTGEEITTDLKQTGNTTFDEFVPAVDQSFTYRVESMGEKSPTYTVSVDPRPSVANVTADYTYPSYTGREPRSEKTLDGAIDALVGTQVKLTLETTQPVKLARMVISDNTPDPGVLLLQPTDKTNTKFATTFTVRRTTDYKIELTNTHDLENKESRPRPITARLDAAPTVTIDAPEGNLRVRAEDAVPVKFTATDDLAVTKVEAVVQVDDQKPIGFILPAPPAKATNFSGSWTFSPRDVLPPGKEAARAKRITYQLRVTDNRDPDPQIGLSARQVLELDQKVAPLADRQDAQAARTLGEAVKQASGDLDEAEKKLQALQQAAKGRPLTDLEKQQAGDARERINHAARTLASAADKTSDSSMADVARRAHEIADQPMHQAEENTAAGQLASDQPDTRDKKFDAAGQNIADAQEQLKQLGQNIDAKAKDQPLARELQRLATEQKKIADGLAQNPNDPALKARQKQLQQDLENVIKQHPELQQPAQAAAKADTQEMQKKLDDLAQTQKQFNDAVKAQQDATIAQDKLNDLAKKQEALNQQIKDFATQNTDALKQAEASHLPSPAQLDAIPKDLQNRNLPGATQGQNATANQLDQAARQLENSQKREQSGEGIRNGSDLQAQASKLQQAIQDAEKNHNPPTRPSDPLNQQASRLADEAKRLAQQQALQSPAQRGAAKQAEQEAEAAKKAAQQGNASEAQQHLSSAASALGGQGSASSADQGKAAAEARRLAEAQRDIANQTSQTDQTLKTAEDSKANAEQSAQAQQQLADKMEEAAKSARELQQKTQGSAPQLSQQASHAAQSLDEAAKAQRSAAQATRNGNSSQAASQQAQAAKQLGDAHQQMQSGGQNGQNSQSGNQQAAQGGQPGSHSGGQSSSNSSAQGSSSPGGSPGQGGKGGQGSAQSGGMTSPMGQMGSTGTGGSGSTTAAQAVQDARNAQSAAAAGDAGAAQRAADQLSSASQQLMNGSAAGGSAPAGTSPGAPTQASGGGMPGGKPGSDGGSGMAGGPRGPADPNARGGGGSGIGPGGPPEVKPMPKSVEEVGMSPSDWANLPPTMQEQLLNSAQQSGPPGYREMIKNYYSRIAKLEQQGGGK